VRPDLRAEVARLLAKLDGPAGEDVLCNLKSLPPGAIAFVAEAYHHETDHQRRQALVHALWQFRDATALPTLTAALREQDEAVWKEALDGIVTIGGEAALRVLEGVRDSLTVEQGSTVKREWIDEAIRQVQETQGSG
jgi:hypothetical protein